MHDCMIPCNVDKRAKEVENFTNDLNMIQADFIELVKQDASYQGDLSSENEIKRQLQDIK
jgi:hypothetical protein